MDDFLKGIVIEDENQLRETLVKKLNRRHDIRIVADAPDVPTAISLIDHHNPDFIFLDIVLIEGDAFSLLSELLKRSIEIPPIILNTGFSDFEYAKNIANHRDYNIVRLLEKPFYENWETIIGEIIPEIKQYKRAKLQNEKYFHILEEGMVYKIYFDQIEYVKVLMKGSGKSIIGLYDKQLNAKNRYFEVNRTLTKILQALPSYFIQISRNEVINANRIIKYNKSERILFLEDSSEEYYVSDSYKSEVLKHMKYL